MVTKRDFEAVAKIVREHSLGLAVAEVFANHFALQNHRFDKKRFLKACGVGN